MNTYPKNSELVRLSLKALMARYVLTEDRGEECRILDAISDLQSEMFYLQLEEDDAMKEELLDYHFGTPPIEYIDGPEPEPETAPNDYC